MKNIGSITSIQYALASDISSISAPDDNGAVDITFNNSKSFSTFTFTPETASFSEEQKDTDAGPLFEQGLSFKLPKIQTIMHAVVESLLDQDIILKITDGNGVTVIMGTPEVPVRASWRMSRPQGASGYNGYEVSFRCNSTGPAPFLDESFEVS